MSELSKAETEAGLDEVEGDLERVDRELEEAEDLLLATPARSLDERAHRARPRARPTGAAK